jgi:hypothetical protein
MSGYFHTLHSLSPVEAFKLITSPMACVNCPLETKTLRHELIILVTKGSLKVDEIIRQLNNIGSLNRYDLTITTLLAINEFLDVDRSVKETISNAIFYLLKKRYLRKNDFTTVRNGFCDYSAYKRPVQKPPLEGKSIHPDGVPKKKPHLPPKPVSPPPTSPPVYASPVYSIPKVSESREKYFQPTPTAAYIPSVEPTFYTTDFYQRPLAYSLASLPTAVSPIIQTSKNPKISYEAYDHHEYHDSSCLCQTKMLELLLNRILDIENHRLHTESCKEKHLKHTPIIHQTYSTPVIHTTVKQQPVPTVAPTSVVKPVLNKTTVHQFGVYTSPQPSTTVQPTEEQPSVPTVEDSSVGSPSIPPKPKPKQPEPDHSSVHNTGVPKKLDVPKIEAPVIPKTTTRAPIIPTVPVKTPEEIKIEKEKENVAIAQNLIKVIPKPEYPHEKQMYEKFKVLLTKPEVQEVVKHMNFSGAETEPERLALMITTILKTVRTEETQEILTYFTTFKEAAEAHFNYGNLIDALPEPKTPKAQHLYNITKKLLTNKDVYHLPKTAEFENSTDFQDKLIYILTEALKSDTVTNEVKEAISYYLPILKAKRANITYNNLVSLLPAPLTDIEKKKFNIMKKVLESDDIHVMMQHVNLAGASDEQRLKLVLRELLTNPKYKDLASVAGYYKNLIITKKHGFNPHDLLKLLNVTTENKPYVDKIDDYFHTEEFDSVLSQLDLNTLSDLDKLCTILQAVQMSATHPEVAQAAGHFVQQLQRDIFFRNMKKIVQLIPQPKTDDEKNKYGIVTSFLLTDKAFDLLNHIDLSVFPDNKLLLEFILKAVVESDVDAAIKDAFEYYIDLTEKLEAIEFITRKEIKKNFKLTEIFTDTLDLKSLSLSQKDAFKKFFKYISEIKPDAMAKFDSWDQAKTRGQFMKLLFAYLLGQPETSPEIKASIQVLDSLVKMNGKGALPP